MSTLPSPDHYLTLAAQVEGVYRAKGSKFLSFAIPIGSEREIFSCIDGLRLTHLKARHYCYAYRLGLTGDRWGANDDGEPKHSAGAPILGQIDSAGITDVLIVVVRYYGGTKLGRSGLIEAYRLAAADALETSLIVQAVKERSLNVSTDWARFGPLLAGAQAPPWRVVTQTLTERVTLTLACPASQFDAAYVSLWLALEGAYPGEEDLSRMPTGYRFDFVG